MRVWVRATVNLFASGWMAPCSCVGPPDAEVMQTLVVAADYFETAACAT